MKLEPSQLLKTGQPLKLSCKVQGTPIISIKWFINGSEISSDLRHTMTFDGSVATLVMENCSVEDSGDYVCMASSEAGSDQSSSSVTVKGRFSLQSFCRLLGEVWSTLVFGMFSAAGVKRKSRCSCPSTKHCWPSWQLGSGLCLQISTTPNIKLTG